MDRSAIRRGLYCGSNTFNMDTRASYWPTYSQAKLMSAIRKHEPLNTCWPSYKIKNFRNSTFSKFLHLK